MLKMVDERYDTIFPPGWRVQHCLLMAFLQQTRQHILEILEGRTHGGGGGGSSVGGGLMGWYNIIMIMIIPSSLPFYHHGGKT